MSLLVILNQVEPTYTELLMRDFLKYTVEHLVDEPDKIIIDMKPVEDKLIFTLQVAKDDIGKVIGRNGRIAQALRTLMRGVGMKLLEHHRDVMLLE